MNMENHLGMGKSFIGSVNRALLLSVISALIAACGGGGGGGGGGPRNLDVNTLNLQDASLRTCVADVITSNSITAANQITSLNCTNRNIQSVSGIQNLTALASLDLRGNQLLQNSVDQLVAAVNANANLNFQFDRTFGIGGAISNLTNSIVVRELVSNQQISVSANGSFQFPFGVADAANFQISLNPNGMEFCSVLNAQGAITNASVANIAINCGTSPQVLFLDFDGATVNTVDLFGAPSMDINGMPTNFEMAQLSPLSAFLDDFGLVATDENDVIDAILAAFTESISDDFKQRDIPFNLGFNVDIRNSRDDGEMFGNQVSRLIVGGTIAESGISTIGVAENIDVGNFSLDDTALILLDLLSAPAPNGNSVNSVIISDQLSDQRVAKIVLIGLAVGNVAAHEAGHYLGNFHTDRANGARNIMDQGGLGIVGLVGLGSDGIFGTADDIDIDFIEDFFTPLESRRGGISNSRTFTEFGLTQGQIPPLCLGASGVDSVAIPATGADGLNISFSIATADDQVRLLRSDTPGGPYHLVTQSDANAVVTDQLDPGEFFRAPVSFASQPPLSFFYRAASVALPNCVSPLNDNEIEVPFTPPQGDQVTDCVATNSGCPTALVDAELIAVGTGALISIGQTTSTIDVQGCDQITDVNLLLDITHPDVSRLAIFLAHDGNESFVTFIPSCLGADINAVYDDSAPMSTTCNELAPGVGVAQPTASNTAIFGRFAPREDFSVFNGTSDSDTWTLEIQNALPNSSGTLNNWGINLTCVDSP